MIDNIFVEFGGQFFQQVIGIPMGTYCAPLLVDLFSYSYEADFMNLCKSGKKSLARSFGFTFRYIDDVLLNNPKFGDYVSFIYPEELEIKDTTDSPTSASYLDISSILTMTNSQAAVVDILRLLHIFCQLLFLDLNLKITPF